MGILTGSDQDHLGHLTEECLEGGGILQGDGSAYGNWKPLPQRLHGLPSDRKGMY